MKNNIDRVYCVKYQQYHKLIVIFSWKLPTNPSILYKSSVRIRLIKMLIPWLAWWLQACKQQGALIKCIEVVIPPGAEYLKIEEELIPTFSVDEIDVKVTYGMQISDPDGKTNSAKNNKYLNEFLRRSSDSN